MAEMHSTHRVRLPRLILIPSLIALAVTLIRLFGELRHWSPTWFDTDAGSVAPSGLTWVIGITWLALPLGVYFATRLIADKQAPAHTGRAMAVAALGIAIFAAGVFVVAPRSGLTGENRLLLIWAFSVVPALLQLLGWPALWRALLAYGLASRLPVAVIMFFAMRGNWGTHYDYGGKIPEELQGSFSLYVWYALIPQLIFWVGFTILLGALSGSITAAVYRRKPVAEGTGALGMAS